MSAFFISKIVIFSFANSENITFLRSVSPFASIMYCFVPSSFSFTNFTSLISVETLSFSA